MGLCFSCKRSKDKFKANGKQICNHQQPKIQSTIFAIPQEVVVAGSAAKKPVKQTGDKFNDTQKNNSRQRRTFSTNSVEDRMATSFSGMNITNPIKGLVSKRRNRYKKDGFDLDLTYITDNIIAMGYPASNIEGVYRNHIDDVVKFLDKKHQDHYYIYNLCSERSYDKAKFHNRVKVFPFDDHNPPKIESIQPFCNDVDEWLRKDEKNVAVVHCKAGKGRTGTMICCYLLHSRKFKLAHEALGYYGQTRTQDKKGVTIPSQMRYIRYYETLLQYNLNYVPVSMYIKEFVFNSVPNLAGGQASISFTISHQTLYKEGEKPTQKCKKLRKNDTFEVKKGGESPFSMKLDYCLPLTGDIKVEFYNKTMMRKEKLFQFWFNTFFVCNMLKFYDYVDEDNVYKVSFDKNELDIVNKKDKQNKVFSADFKLTMIVQRIPRDDCCPPSYERNSQVQDTPSESSADSSDDYTNEEDDWDSGEGILLLSSRPNEIDSIVDRQCDDSTTISTNITTNSCDVVNKS